MKSFTSSYKSISFLHIIVEEVLHSSVGIEFDLEIISYLLIVIFKIFISWTKHNYLNVWGLITIS